MPPLSSDLKMAMLFELRRGLLTNLLLSKYSFDAGIAMFHNSLAHSFTNVINHYSTNCNDLVLGAKYIIAVVLHEVQR